MNNQLLTHSLKHIAVIMDGNGRWAASRSLPRVEGHRRGMRAAKEIVLKALDLRIPHLTLYAFSLENWDRPLTEVRFLMSLLCQYAKKERHYFHERGVRVNVIGDFARLPGAVQSELEQTMELTKNNQGLHLHLGLSYGGRDELIRASRKMMLAVQRNELNPSELTEENFADYLDTRGIPDPDLVIRTSGEERISNFLLWQIAYSELFFVEKPWPEFTPQDLEDIVRKYQQRSRRFGKLEVSQDLSSQTG